MITSKYGPEQPSSLLLPATTPPHPPSRTAALTVGAIAKRALPANCQPWQTHLTGCRVLQSGRGLGVMLGTVVC